MPGDFLKSHVVYGLGYNLIRTVESHNPIGFSGFLKKPNLEKPDFGFAMLPEHCGRDLAYEACEAVLVFGIEQHGFPVLDAISVSSNHKSIHLLQKLSFAFDSEIPSEDSADPLVLYRRKCSS